MAEKKVNFDYLVGTMIEVPRGAVTADHVAQSAEFFSFGTNDLTQMALGISRGEWATSSCHTLKTRSLRKTRSPLSTKTGVGQLMQIAVEKGRRSS